MPRRARIAIAGIPWHIIQRGSNRSACFFADEYPYYLDTLAEQAVKWQCAIHAYGLMTNHVHLLLTPVQPDSTATMMKHLGQRYVHYVNCTYGRSGTLWACRLKISAAPLTAITSLGISDFETTSRPCYKKARDPG